MVSSDSQDLKLTAQTLRQVVTKFLKEKFFKTEIGTFFKQKLNDPSSYILRKLNSTSSKRVFLTAVKMQIIATIFNVFFCSHLL